MKEIIAYKTKTGEIFENIRDCLEEEVGNDLIVILKEDIDIRKTDDNNEFLNSIVEIIMRNGKQIYEIEKKFFEDLTAKNNKPENKQ